MSNLNRARSLVPATLVWLICAACLAAESPRLVYQGRLLSSGVPLNGSCDLRIGLYDAETGGQRLGNLVTNTAVTVQEGAFSVSLDSAAMFFDGSPRWLEIGVRTNGSAVEFTVLQPRQAMITVPQSVFALRAGTAGMATNLVGGGRELTAVPAASLYGSLPLGLLSGITTNQIDKATDLVYRDKTQRGVVTPFECGAYGDGIHDDTAALQEMINRACKEELIAFLPPAPGGFYKITDTLRARNTLTMIGAGGAKHISSYPLSRCVIKQFTPGKDGLVLESPNDSVHLASLVITAEPTDNWTNDCNGVWFAGGATDADCSILEQCLVSNFGVGVRAASNADSTFRQCSFGNNGTGIRISGEAANNISLDSCQLSYNWIRQVDIRAGKVVIQNCDIAAGADGTPRGRSSQGLYCYKPDLVIIGSRFEDYSTNDCLIISEHSRVTLISTSFGNYSGAPRYSVALTNATLTAINCAFDCRGPGGVPIFDSTFGRSSVYAVPPVQEIVSVGWGSYVNTASTFASGRSLWTGTGPGPGGIGVAGWAMPGTLEWENAGYEHFLWAYGTLPQKGLQAVDLLAFAKQQTSGLVGNGGGLTNLSGANILPGTITSSQMDSATDALYRNPNAITNNQASPVFLGGDLVVSGNLNIIPGSLVVRTNPPPDSSVPAAWFEVKTSDGSTWKVPLYKPNEPAR